MATVYRQAMAGQTIDDIALAHYAPHRPAGDVAWPPAGLLQAVYAANRPLARHGSALPAGVMVALPDITIAAASKARVKLWGVS